jgi:hypothetical protein
VHIYNAADMPGQLNKSSLDHDTFSQHPTKVAIHKFSLIQQINSEEATELLNRYNKKMAFYRDPSCIFRRAAYLDARIQCFDKHCNPTAVAIFPGASKQTTPHIPEI